MAKITNRPISTEVVLRASPVQGGGYDRAWRLHIEDARSGSLFAEITLNPEQLFDLLTSRNTAEAEAEIFQGENIGKYAENASKDYPRSLYDGGSGLSESQARDAAVADISAERGDGWRAWSTSATNKGTWSVGLVRYHDQPVEQAK